jgi:diguanylate cyclase (GGDEF)-like protein
MDQPAPLFEKERQTLENARRALAQAPDAPLAGPFGELALGYEALLERAGRVAALADSIQSDLDAAMDQVAQLSQVDGLTGVTNRRAFEKLFARDWAQAQREGSALSLLIINLDRFRAFNQLHGALAGDDCLRGVAQALLRCLFREVDVVARMEGDTFAALLPGADAEGAAIVARRVLEEVAALEIVHLESPHGGVVTVSVGVATVRPERSDAPMLLARKAQEALGEAKQGGGALVVQAPAESLPQGA